MNRALLCSAIERLASSSGYNFQLDNEGRYPTTLCRYPAAFMTQPKFVSLEGRQHGRITYEVTLRLAQTGAKLAPSERNAMLSRMESEAMELFIDLSREKSVAVVDKLTISTLPEVVDAHGALAIEAKAQITTIF